MLTIFTPTYRRPKLLTRLYESLLRQTCKDFEWIVVDDSPGTESQALGEKWQKETTAFPVRYVRLKNGCKPRAWNLAVQMAKGEGFCGMDDDDYFTDDAVEKMLAWFGTIQDQPKYNGIAALRGYDMEHPIGGYVSMEGAYIDAPQLDPILEKKGLLSDKATVYKTEVLLHYPFTNYEDEYWSPESLVLLPMGLDGYLTRWYNEIVVLGDYLSEGMSHRGSRLLLGSPRAAMDLMDLQMKEQWRVEEVAAARRWLVFQYLLEHGQEKAKQVFQERLPVEFERAIVLSGGARKNVGDFLSRNRLSHIAVYGLGGAGQMFLAMVSPLHVQMVYGIDRCAAEFGDMPFPVFAPTDELPRVDAIVVCLRNGAEAVAEELAGRGTIFCMSDLCGDTWKDLWA